MFYVFAILAFGIVYRRARSAGRNGYLWGFVSAIAFITVGLLATFWFGMLLGFCEEFFTWTKNTVAIFSIVFSLLAWGMSFATTALILRYFTYAQATTSPSPPQT